MTENLVDIQTFGWLSVLPPVLTIILAIWTRQVVLSLFAGLWIGHTVLMGGNPLAGLRTSLDAAVDVFKDSGNTRVIAYCLMVGALIVFIEASGGVRGFINFMSRRGFLKTQRRAQLFAYFTGVLIFVESSITSLVTGAIFRPIFDKLKLSREKLAYICDSTSAPICILIPFNGWGAFIIGLLAAQNIGMPFGVLLKSIFFNFYAILSLLVLLVIILWNRDFGPMVMANERAENMGETTQDDSFSVNNGHEDTVKPRALNMLVPIAVMMIILPLGLYITGEGNVMKGSGSTSVFWAVIGALFVGGAMYFVQGIMRVNELVELFMKGVGALAPVGFLMVLAFAVGSMCRELNTGIYIASLFKGFFSGGLLPALLFITGCFIAFSTGTSWGTFAIMLPIGIPLVGAMDGNLYLCLGAMLGGGVFGDHCSPISDTTIISSMATSTDHVEHVKTQLPYAVFSAACAFLLYLVLGFII